MTLQKLGFADKNEAASLSNEDVVNQINKKLLEIFGVNSKEEISNIESKEILAKLDSVFKIREDNQPNVDYPVSKGRNLDNFILYIKETKSSKHLLHNWLTFLNSNSF